MTRRVAQWISSFTRFIPLIVIANKSVHNWRSYHLSLVPERIVDGDVAFHGSHKHAIGRQDEWIPERQSRHPDATDELITWAVTWHTSSVQFEAAWYVTLPTTAWTRDCSWHLMCENGTVIRSVIVNTVRSYTREKCDTGHMNLRLT